MNPTAAAPTRHASGWRSTVSRAALFQSMSFGKKSKGSPGRPTGPWGEAPWGAGGRTAASSISRLSGGEADRARSPRRARSRPTCPGCPSRSSSRPSARLPSPCRRACPSAPPRVPSRSRRPHPRAHAGGQPFHPPIRVSRRSSARRLLRRLRRCCLPWSDLLGPARRTGAVEERIARAILVGTARRFLDARGFDLAASLAYSALLTLVPLVACVTILTSTFFGQSGTGLYRLLRFLPGAGRDFVTDLQAV